MSEVKHLLNSLLWDIYGKQQQQRQQLLSTPPKSRTRLRRCSSTMAANILGLSQNPRELHKLSLRKLIDMCAILKVEIRLMGYFLERVLISRDRNLRHQEVLCAFVDAILQLEMHDAHPKMRFSLSPPPPKASVVTSPTNNNNNINTNTRLSNMNHQRDPHRGAVKHDDAESTSSAVTGAKTADDAASDYHQWLHAMKLVARLPGGMPPEFRRKLWLSLADKYLKTKNVDWSLEEEKCFCEKWREDDEELGIQIVKDLHRTGSNLCTGPAGSINQAKLKRILLGYARYNPEVGYCQGFNMLGALILQVMDKEEAESMKVMIYLVEGVLPHGYFCGSMGGLQADMGVFRDLMQTKLPRLAKHLQKLQGPIENAYEPPLTNVFTMQWFLTMFCTCLPMTCVLRVWDLVLIEGSDVLLRTALVLWSLLEERVLSARTADDFYCKMGSFSSELLNGHLIDSNGLIEKVVQLGAIPDIQKLRDKHLYNIAPLRHKQGLQLYFDDEEPESDEESRMAVATVWGIPWGRRGSHETKASSTIKQTPENKDRIALDISLLKKQYDRLRERQKQAHIILTTACSTARQGSAASAISIPNQAVPVNQLLMGRSAIVTNRGRRIGPPPGAIPPARKPSLPAVLQTKAPDKQLRRGETLHWRDTDLSKRRRDSLTWKEIKADRAATLSVDILDTNASHKLRTRRMGKSDSSSYSEESDEDDAEGSSTDTSLCDEDDPTSIGDKAHTSSKENSPKRRSKSGRKHKDMPKKLQTLTATQEATAERKRPKSWAPTTNEIPFMLMTSDSPVHSGDEKSATSMHADNLLKEEEDSATESDRFGYRRVKDLDWSGTKYSPIAGDLATTKLAPLHVHTDILNLPAITSTSQLSPMPDISTYLNNSTISPLPTPKPLFLDSTNSLGSGDGDDVKKFDVSDDGVTNEYFERVNSVERPTKLDLFYSLNEEDGIITTYDDNEKIPNDEHKTDISEPNYKSEFIFKPDNIEFEDDCVQQKIIIVVDDKDTSHNRRMELFMDYSEKSSAAFIAEATSELTKELRKEKLRDEELQKLSIKAENEVRDDHIPGENRDDFKEESIITESKPANTAVKLNRTQSLNNASRKRRDPRRLTLVRSSTIDIEERYQALERQTSMDNFSKQNQNSNNSENSSSKKECTKIIPTTADLEERYNTLERQLSKGKAKNSDNALINVQNDIDVKKCADEHNDKKKIPISEPDTELPIKPKRDRIPSTADLENRFNALERQMSSNNVTPKNSIDLKSSTNDENDKKETGKKETKEHSQEEAKLQKAKTDTDTDSKSTEVGTEQTSEHEKPRLTKLPSTAELEDRFNALERKKSIQNSSFPKSKKEPPDEPVEQHDKSNQEQAVTDCKDIESEIDERKEQNLIKNISEEKKSIDESKNCNDEVTEVASNEDTANTEKQKVSLDESSKDKTNVKTNKPNSPSIRKKSPPSTEELEKRFQALEKQLSTTSFDNENESQNKKKSSPAKPKKEEALIEEPKHTNKQLSEANSKEETESKITESMSAEENKNKIKKTKLFEDTCKSINENLSVECSKTADIQTEYENVAKENSENPQQIKSIQSFNDKCKEINEQLEQANELEKIEMEEKLANELQKRKEQRELAKRRASEPPSTEDLEKRYESLQRRMSSKTIVEEILTKSETVEEALERIEKRVIVEATEVEDKNKDNTKLEAEVLPKCGTPEIFKSEEKKEEKTSSGPPTTEDLENRFEALQQKHKPSKKETTQSENVSEEKKLKETKISTQTVSPRQVELVDQKVSSVPPSTEDLESRFEALQQKSSSKNNKAVDTNENKRSQNENLKFEKKNVLIDPQNGVALSAEHDKEVIPINKSNIVNIPDAPPMPKKEPTEMFFKHNNTIDDAKDNQRRALIEEFQSKIKTQPNDENLKPSDINPNRKTPPAQKAARHNVDDTSEAHADPAFYRSEYYEPWQMQQKRMVRRFSDLPSRSDLENRLQFLEKQLAKKFYKQRCASDSEVASRRHFVVLPPQTNDDDEKPSSSTKNKRSPNNLESRVQALEKQLSENSLKLLEAMRTKTQETAGDCESPRRLSTETIDATGKELVRYTHFGELEETESHKPINISINIKMLLNKDESGKKGKTEDLPTTEELEKRLEVLEEQIKASRARGAMIPEKKDTKVVSEANIIEKNEKLLESETPALVEKLQKDIVNKEVKTDSADTIQQLEHKSKSDGIEVEKTPEELLKIAHNSEERKPMELTKKSQDTSMTEKKTEVTKEEKTMENQEIARSNKSKDEEKKSIVNEEKCNKADDNQIKDEDNKITSKNDATQDKKVCESDTQKSDGKTENITEATISNELSENVVINAGDVGLVDPNNKTLVLLLDNEPKSNKVRRLTRANTEELEGLFQALEKQLSERNLIKSDDGKLIRADSNQQTKKEKTSDESKAISDLTKEIEQFTSNDKETAAAVAAEAAIKPKVEEDYDWGPDPVKRHLKRRTVHLPSTKELESRFRSLERQIKLLEDVEKIDVEQRLSEIERKIKLQYSLSQERDLTKFLELCEGKGLDDYADIAGKTVQIGQSESPRQSPARSKAKSPHTSPSRVKDKTPHTSPTRSQERKSPYTSPSRSSRRSPYTSPSRSSRRSPYTSPSRQKHVYDGIPSLEDLEYRYRILELPRSKSKELLDERARKMSELKKNAVHPIEMLLDLSPDGNGIPITGELEHRMRVLDETSTSPSPPRKSRSRSPTIDDIKRQKMLDNQKPRTPIHNLERLVASPTKRELPTEDELEARMRALEQEQCFDFKMQKNFNEFNQKLKDVISPSLSFEEFKYSKSREQSPRRTDVSRTTTVPKSAMRDADTECRREEYHLRSTSPKVIRFREDEEYNRPRSRTEQQRYNERMVGNTEGVLQIIQENSKMLHRILKKTLADSHSSIISGASASEGLDEMGSRLMRETSPITRTGTHTGVPLRTDDNINDRLNSIKNTIKSIDTLCEEKPYRKEKCQRYIDSLFTDSVYFASPHKKTSMEDLSRSASRTRHEYTPSIRVSDHSQRPSDYYLSRSMGSAESIRSTSPLRAASPLHYRSNRDLRRDTSPRRRRDEEREEYESRVRRENMLPNYFLDNHSDLSSGSLTKFHKVDRQLDTYKYDEREKSSSRSASRSPLRSPYGSRETMMMLHTTNTATANTSRTTPANSIHLDLDRPVSPYRQTSHNLLHNDSALKRSTTPVYAPAKLEIRHTTVTSTFYDRLLTEKQIEKNNLSRPPSRSPVVSPSVTSKSYLDIPIASATTTTTTTNTKTSNANSPITTTAQVRGIMGTTDLSFGSNYTSLPSYVSSTHITTTTFNTLPTYTTTSFNSFTTQYSATTPTGNSSTYHTALFSGLPPLVTDASSHIDLRIRSCDNILMQLKSTPTPTTTAAGANSSTVTGPSSSSSALLSSCTAFTATTPSATNNFTSLYNPTTNACFNYTVPPSSNTSSITANTTTITTTTTTTTTTLFNPTTTSSYSTGVYSSLLPLNTRQTSDISGISLGLYTSTLNNNNTTDSSYGNSATELPKY